MNRTTTVRQLRKSNEPWDILIIGGGATGLGCGIEAASRGYRTILLEQHDFAKGTSSRSTKLVHGGVRYLQQGNISLVLEALKERGYLLQNAPHLVKNLSFIVPGYRWWEKLYYTIGLTIYDWLAGKLGFGRSKMLSRKETLDHIPTLEPEKLRGGVLYHDGQFDDARLAVNMMQTIYDHGGTALNYFKVTRLLKEDGKLYGVTARDEETGEEIDIRAKVVINATGVFTDTVRQMDDPDTEPIIQVSQGVHIVLDRSFHPGNSALMIPKTADGRVLFAVPWHHKVIVGTTDTAVSKAMLEPSAKEEEIEFLISHAGKYLTGNPGRSDIRSIFTGLRPLVKPKESKSTKSISRDHTLITDPSGLITITGGKWTTYRKMGEDTINQAIHTGDLKETDSETSTLNIHGWSETDNDESLYSAYGADADAVRRLSESHEGWAKPLHPDLPCTPGMVVWAARNEMARTVEDILSRRTRSLLLNARASMEVAPRVASLLAKELGCSGQWEKIQADEFRELARTYLPVH
ncbi:MAG: glycerol-3-phosphate dehydrogenase/oxidase [Balneolaceae bacterium]